MNELPTKEEREALTRYANTLRAHIGDGLAGLIDKTIAAIVHLESELERFKRGELKDEEFQNLCHRLENNPQLNVEQFARGCAEYQIKLFGRCPTQDLISRLVDGIKWWADQEDGVPEELWEAYADAVELTTGKRPIAKD